jgi:CheY-specific phosphatase CheX
LSTINTGTTETSADHRECVAQAAVSVLGDACGQTLESCEDEPGAYNDGAVIGVISIVGGVEWSIFLGLPRATAVALTETFAGFPIPFDSEDMGDAVGELTNILAGDVKRRLEGKSVEAAISLPSVVRAESLQVLVQRGTSVTKTCFACAAGKLWTGVVSSKEGGFVA